MRLKIVVISLLMVVLAFAKENKVQNMIEKMELFEMEGKSVAEVTLCNQSNEVYYYYKNTKCGKVIYGFTLKQNGEKLKYKGAFGKFRDVFPDSYNTIDPNECLVYSAPLSNLYNFNPNEEVEISYGIGFHNKEGEYLGANKFTKIFKKVQKTDANKKFECIRRYRLE